MLPGTEKNLVARDPGGFVTSKYDSFCRKNAEDWRSLEDYNRRFGAYFGKRKLQSRDVREFARLLRLASFHLAYCKTHFPNSDAVRELNRIVGAAQNNFYAKTGAGTQVVGYFLYTFPQALRDSWKFWGLATAFFFAGLVFAAFYVSADLHRLSDVVPAFIADGFSPYEAPDFGDGSVDVDYTLFTAVIMTNNIIVAINAFALGIFAGLGTIYIMLMNGLMLGGLFGYLHTVGGDMLVAYALVLPHGVLELFAIFICGGCGLMLGKGLLIPGDYTRRHSITLYAKKAAVLMPGVVTMLVIAAIIEGFFTPLAIPAEFKLVFAAITGIAFVAYCFLLQKDETDETHKNRRNHV